MNSAQKIDRRVAELREEAAQQGRDVAELTDAEFLLDELSAARKEAYDAGHKVQGMLVEREAWRRKAASALQRKAQLERVRIGEVYLAAAIRQGLRPITSLVYRVENLPDRLSPKAMAEFKSAIGDIADVLRVTQQRIDADPQVALLGEQRAEILRLIEYITERGQTLHKELSRDGAEIGCECPGCELIVGMGDVPLPDDSEATDD